MTEIRTEFQTCRGARLTRETKILHQGGLKFTREFLKNHQVPWRSKFHQGGQNNSPGRVPPGLWQRCVEMAMHRRLVCKFLCKLYASTEKHWKSPNILWLFWEFYWLLSLSMYVRSRIMCICFCPLQILAINWGLFTKLCNMYLVHVRWSHEDKSNGPVEMNICAFRLILVDQDPVVFIFTWLFLCRNFLTKDAQLNMYKLVSNGHFYRGSP